ncbi:MAG: uncharacterized protein A8A55_3617, partial [Amphiamblys sp. WSBS2006]
KTCEPLTDIPHILRFPDTITCRATPASMEDKAMTSLKIKDTFFVFAHKHFFLVPRSEFEQFEQNGRVFVFVKRKYLTEGTCRENETTICIVCNNEPASEDKVFPLCRKIHFVVCGCCAQELLLEKGMFKKR